MADERILLPEIAKMAAGFDAHLVGRPLADLDGLERIPACVLGWHDAQLFTYLSRDEAKRLGRSDEDLWAEALGNLSRIRGTWAIVHQEQNRPAVLMHDDAPYACERILDARFLAAAHDALGAELLAVAMPTRGALVCRNANSSPQAMGEFMGWIARIGVDHGALFPTVFLRDQKHGVVGYVKSEA